MSLFNEINHALVGGMDAFTTLITEKLKRDKNLLDNFYLTQKGKQQTILNYLIQLHSERNNLQPYIQWLLQQEIDINVGQPLHLVFQQNKLDLMPFFLIDKFLKDSPDKNPRRQRIHFDSRDIYGKTLLHRIIEHRKFEPLVFVVEQQINVNQSSETQHEGQSLEVQPIHQAVISNFPEAIAYLAKVGAQFNNPCGELRETPLLLAARLLRIRAIKELLTQSLTSETINSHEFLNALNANRYNAMNLLCTHLYEGNKSAQALRGIAMLLCHGVAVPSYPVLRNLLMNYRQELYLAVKEYARDKPQLAANFLRKCHNKADPLHDIIYAKDSWGQSMRHLFGKADDLAFKLETLTLPKKKISSSTARTQLVPSESEAIFAKDEILFAEFVRRYKESIKSVIFFNPWSEMLHLLATGEVTCWAHVMQHAQENKNSRTEQIVKDMLDLHKSPHENLDESCTI
ncbi:Dot/Icm T4SS effector AnkC/LegA12 [Legionella cardiaca]|uniref:Ankyrin repeats (3 copies) n=1 Tax=Legionella cardiaca TaxID=1071983 RepID=A0ABY8ARX3_9GAMM|nr:Dot/Icm T4SS effector AnkC/LegA12 [Legionella cardiaca]WED43427.1 hypothetical protein PXX05_01245 [Legionella cardiaca]